MKHHKPISHIMSTQLVTVHHGDPISKVRKLMQETGVHHIPVVSGVVAQVLSGGGLSRGDGRGV